ncbi:MAG: MFS transporter [Blautia sp.]|jgi:UMF1 family MFS transporter
MEKLSKIEKHWILYDVGNSAYVMLCTTIIPLYFKNIASQAGVSLSDSTAYLSYALSLSTILVAFLGPVLGTMADTKDYKKPMFTAAFLVGVVGCLSLMFPSKWLSFLVIFVVGRVGYQLSLIFYDSMLTDITSDERMDEVSSYGYAWGYIGSCIPFVASLLLILFAEKLGLTTGGATGIAFAINAFWWLFTTLPLLGSYRQVHCVEKVGHPVKESFGRIGNVLKKVGKKKEILFFLLGFFFYIDGVYTIIDLATSYGKDVGIDDTHLLLALLLTQVVAFPCAILFARFSKGFQTAKLIRVCILGYLGIALFALQLDCAWEFWFLAVCVAVFQGAIQALSRSYFARIIPKENSSEYFGFYDIFGKGAAFVGTMMMGVSTQLFGSSKAGVALLAVMFVIGFALFSKAVSYGKKTA